jgi:hypothetical protein
MIIDEQNKIETHFNIDQEDSMPIIEPLSKREIPGNIKKEDLMLILEPRSKREIPKNTGDEEIAGYISSKDMKTVYGKDRIIYVSVVVVSFSVVQCRCLTDQK